MSLPAPRISAQFAPLALAPVAFALLFTLAPSVSMASGSHHARHVVAYRVRQVINLPGYTAVRPVAFDSQGDIAGDAGRDGARRCLLWSGGNLTDITPADWQSCAVTGMNASGTVVGQVQSKTTTAGFVYRAGHSVVFTDALAFTSINNSLVMLGVKADGTQGIFDALNGKWLSFSDDSTGCRLEIPVALNDGYVFGRGACGSPAYVVASGDGVESAALPADLFATSIFTDRDQLVVFDPRPGGHAYLWSPSINRAPQDLGFAPGEPVGTYTPVAASGREAIVGTNAMMFFSWVWTPVDGMRDLDTLVRPQSYFGLAVADVRASGEILARAFDTSSDDGVWIVLQPI